MIQNSEIEQKAKEFQINTSNLQRDYVFGWLLSGIYGQTRLGEKLILKGGNGLRKGYLRNTRFSKDLDFSVTDAVDPTVLSRQLQEVCNYAQDRSGVLFEADKTRIDKKPGFDNEQTQVYEARIYFKSFYGEEEIVLKVQLDVTTFDKIFLPVQSRPLIHPYSDEDKCTAVIRCHKLEEILASKMNAALQRRKVTDLFDLVYSIIINNDYDVSRPEVISTFLKKTIYESNPNTAKDLLLNVPVEEYRPFWQEIIAPVFSLFDFDRAVTSFKDLVTGLFTFIPSPAFSPAPATYGGGYARLTRGFDASAVFSYFPSAERNVIITAGRTQKLVRMVYDGAARLIEPYAFEYRIRKKDGRGMEYFWGWNLSGGKSGIPGIRKFISDKIQSVSETDISFSPRFAIEL
ncbi:hypothetical protein C4565_01435 [Candidatus Parcubacteria bacterium]|nr:MAG: hypothetical protein C4565_01435 [Candidatus Parcubacteria bacterium]